MLQPNKIRNLHCKGCGNPIIYCDCPNWDWKPYIMPQDLPPIELDKILENVAAYKESEKYYTNEPAKIPYKVSYPIALYFFDFELKYDINLPKLEPEIWVPITIDVPAPVDEKAPLISNKAARAMFEYTAQITEDRKFIYRFKELIHV